MLAQDIGKRFSDTAQKYKKRITHKLSLQNQVSQLRRFIYCYELLYSVNPTVIPKLSTGIPTQKKEYVGSCMLTKIQEYDLVLCMNGTVSRDYVSR
jgi:hypothetical protein